MIRIKNIAPRAATLLFKYLGFQDRRAVLRSIQETYFQLPKHLRERHYSLLKEHHIIVKDVLAMDLAEKHISKTIDLKRLEQVATSFEKEIQSQQFQLLFQSSLPLEEVSGINLRLRALLLLPEKPLALEEIFRDLKTSYPDLKKEELKTALDTLKHGFPRGRVIETLDGEYAWIERTPDGRLQNRLQKEGSLFQLFRTEEYISREGLKKRLEEGSVVEIHRMAGKSFVWKNIFDKLLLDKNIVKVLGENPSHDYFLFADELHEAALEGNIIFGLDQKGKNIAIATSPEAIARHRIEIFAREIEVLFEELEDYSPLKYEEKQLFTNRLWAAFESCERSGILSPFRISYMAKKAVRMKEPPAVVLAAVLSVLPMGEIEKTLKTNPLFEGQENEGTLNLIRDCKIAGAIPFRIPSDDNHFIQNFMWMLMVLMKDPKSLKLALFQSLSALLFPSREINSQAGKRLFAPLAERFGFHEISEDLRNLLFKIENAAKHLEYQQKIDGKTGLSLQPARKYLAELSENLKKELTQYDIPASAIQIESRRKAEVTAYEKVEIRKQRTFEDIPDLMAIKIVINSQEGSDPVEKERKNMEYLKLAHLYLHEKYKPGPSQVEDNIDKPRKSGWQAITFERVLTDEGKEIEIQLMTQRMYENERFLKLLQAHWYYALQRDVPSQKFDEYPLELLDRLTGDFERDYALLRNYLLSNWVFVFYAVDGEKLSRSQKDNLVELVSSGKVKLQIKRVPRGATPVDLAAGAGLLSNYGGADVYTFSVDGKDRPVVKPVEKQRAKLQNFGIDHQLRNGDIVALRSSEKAFDGKTEFVKAARLRAKKPAAAIWLRKLLLDPELEQDAKSGQKALRPFALDAKQLGIIMAQYKFNDIKDLHAAVGSGLINVEEIREFVEGVVVTAEGRDGDQILKVRSPDAKGLIHAILREFPHDISLEQITSSDYYLFGEKHTAIVLRLPASFGIKVGGIRGTVRRFLRDYPERKYPAKTFTCSITVLSQAGEWKIKELVEKLNLDNVNIFSINLPEVRANETREGIIQIEIPIETKHDQIIFDVLMAELKEFPGVSEIS